MNISHLKYPPLKYKYKDKLPDKLLIHSYFDYFGHAIDQFVMVSTKKSDEGKHAFMRCFPENIKRDSLFDIPSLYVQFLSSNCSGSGFGTAMLDFVRNYSKQIGCGGRFHLTADVALMPNRVPHPFYRKYGMNTGIHKVDKKLDKFVKNGKDATYKDFKNVEMYYPPLQSKTKTTFLSLLYKALKFKYGLE